jgi:hypothetical protein
MRWHRMSDAAATSAAGQPRQHLRQLVERALVRDQPVQQGLAQQLQRQRQAPAVAPARCAARGRRWPTCELLSTSRREWKASPSGTLTARLPYQLSSSTVASKPASRSAVASPRHGRWRAPRGRPRAWRRRAARSRRPAQRPRRRATGVDHLHRAARHAGGQPGHQQAQRAAADHRDALADARRGVPQRVDRGLEQLAASTARAAGTPPGKGSTASAGTWYSVWCGCRQNTVRPHRSCGPASTTPTLT